MTRLDPLGRRPETDDALRRLLGRKPDPEYLEAWRRSLRHAVFTDEEKKDASAVLFRVGTQWLALAPDALAEVRPWAPIRRIPGRSNALFRGLVSLRGELHLCADLHALLGVEVPPPRSGGQAPRAPESRLLTVGREDGRWTFEVDEVRGVESYARAGVLPPQSTVAKALFPVTDGLIAFGDLLVARIEPERLLASFDRSLDA